MLRNLLKLITTPLAKSKASTRASPNRHLSMHTIYPSNKLAAYQTILPNQYKLSEILLTRPGFETANVEPCQLDENALLIGLTRHTKGETILGCIFMYPESIRHSEDWQSLFDKADQQKTGIAIFKPTRSINCFKIMLETTINPYAYLIHNRDISRQEWLLQPPRA